MENLIENKENVGENFLREVLFNSTLRKWDFEKKCCEQIPNIWGLSVNHELGDVVTCANCKLDVLFDDCYTSKQWLKEKFHRNFSYLYRFWLPRMRSLLLCRKYIGSEA